MVVGLTNPKTIAFFVAVLPQFVSPAAGPVWAQLLVLGLLFQVLALLCDSAWALAAGRIGAIIGPIATGEFITRDWSLTAVFISIASLSIISSITVILLPIRRELHHDAAKT